MRRVPRQPDKLPDDLVAGLRRARRQFDADTAKATAEFRAVVVAALEHGSVRQVAAAAKLSPTTVQAWSKDQQ